MPDIGQSVVAWLDKNLDVITRNAMLQNGMVKWGGRSKTGDAIPVGTAVLHGKSVMLASHKGLQQIADLKRMESSDVTVDDISLPTGRSREEVIASMAVKYAIRSVASRVVKPDGFYRWRGVFKSGRSYRRDDMAVYNGFVYRANTGSGIPGNSNGWKRLK